MTGDLSEADRSLLVVMSRVLDPSTLNAYTEMLPIIPTDPAITEFDNLPADTDEQTRHELAERLVAFGDRLRTEHPALKELRPDVPTGVHPAARTLAVAVKDLYNRAQIDVLHRIRCLRRTPPRTDPT
ncbi:hypothetical protein [Saccharopolyspora phatthalungensis]|uniref:Uncharacterized protein n=1 Tax=Saccharopolyspora phatthalungensis TaxID=664693 RepID=A0A840Q9S6_9PSEU|nr:hypothetical protein [Saccharopolyspora phatthalungensis]MBB5159282.1 hypothetical protein [Saccharopolyspora phatthalungensis]